MLLNESTKATVRGNEVEVNPKLLRIQPYDVAIDVLFNPPDPELDVPRKEIESHSHGTQPLVAPRGNLNPLLQAASFAFAYHLPLTLSPDMIWLLIAQGFAMHVQQNADAMRSRFVAHSGQPTLMVRRDEFVRGFAGNDWEGVFSEFSDKIAQIVGDFKHSLIVQTFSTTSFVDRAAVEITLMTALQSYFAYVVVTRCGIPRFDLEGTAEDWARLRIAAMRLQEYDLDWWIPTLLPVLDRFVDAAEGRESPDFWGSFFKESGGSGGPYISGHILQLFPYILDHKHQLIPSPWLKGKPEGTFHKGVTTAAIPCGLSVAPFTWLYGTEKIPMQFVAGFVGTTQDVASYAVRPEIGWCVQSAE